MSDEQAYQLALKLHREGKLPDPYKPDYAAKLRELAKANSEHS